jgi:hypothetical protein
MTMVAYQMNEQTFETEFKKKVCAEIRLVPKGLDKWFVQTPFTFNDGDTLAIVLKKDEDGKWILSDEGHTFMHLSYEEVDLTAKTRQKVIHSAMNMFGIQNRDGELIIEIPDGCYGEALFSMVQGLIQIFDVSYLRRENVRTAFAEDFREYIRTKFKGHSFHFDFSPEDKDPDKLWPVDCVIKLNGKPLFVYAILNDSQCKLATANILYYENQGMDFIPIAIYEKMEDISAKDIARMSNASMKQFSSLDAAKLKMDKVIGELGLITA